MSNELEAKAEMLIRRPVFEVYEAFINPEITSKFWFTDGSGPLIQDSDVEWNWSMYNLTVPVKVISVTKNQNILIEWGENSYKSKVEFNFKKIGEENTFLSIRNFDFLGTEQELVAKVIDSTGGFNIVIAGLKAYLEHHIELNLIADKSPMN